MNKNQYGIDVNTLHEFVGKPAAEKTAWGSRSLLISKKEFSLERVEIRASQKFPFAGNKSLETTVYIEEGGVEVSGTTIGARESISFAPSSRASLEAKENSVVYLFSGEARGAPGEYGKKQRTSDYRDKYWGSIETIISKKYAGKRIFCRKGKHASLEYHRNKIEAYYVHSGNLLTRLRAGRAEEKFFEMPAGSTIFIPPGLMHQRGGLEDTVIVEISTRDEDADSFLVEDGQKTPMPNLIK